MRRLFCFTLILLASVGCGQPDSVLDSGLEYPPKFGVAEVYAKNKGGGSGSSIFYIENALYSPDPATRPLEIKFGLRSDVNLMPRSDLTWEYLGTDTEGDRYIFEWILSLDEQNVRTEVEEIVYEGEEVVLFDNDVYRIGMRPVSQSDQARSERNSFKATAGGGHES